MKNPMKIPNLLAGLLSGLLLIIFSGCATVAYHADVESSPPGARVEVNGDVVGVTPCTIRIDGDPDGTFHDFNSPFWIIKVYPLTTDQFLQTKVFQTGYKGGPEDLIPKHIYFDLTVKTVPVDVNVAPLDVNAPSRKK